MFNYSRSSTAKYLDQTTSYFIDAATNEPRFTTDGLILEMAATNLLLNSEAPVTQTVTVTNGTQYTLAAYGEGAGYAFISDGGSGTAPIGNPVTFTAAGTSVEISVSGTLEGFQLEAGTKASSFIATAGATVSRSADILTRALDSGFSTESGSFFIEFTHDYQAIFGTNLILSSGASRAFIRCAATGEYKSYSGTVTNDYPSASSPGINEKLAISIENGEWILARNGSSLTYSTADPMLDITTLNFFEAAAGTILRFEYWPTTKSAEELETLTSHPPVIIPRVDVLATITDVGSDNLYAYTEAGFSYDFSDNSRYFGTCSLTVIEGVDLFGLLMGNNGVFRILLKHDGAGAIPQNFFNELVVEGVGTLTSSSATYTASLGTTGYDTTEWSWNVGGNITSAGWTNSSSKTVQFVGVIENV